MLAEWKKSFRLLAAISAHAVATALTFGAIFGLEKLIALLWEKAPGHSAILQSTITWLFNAVYVLAALTFLAGSTVEIIRAFRSALDDGPSPTLDK